MFYLLLEERERERKRIKKWKNILKIYFEKILIYRQLEYLLIEVIIALVVVGIIIIVAK